MLCTTRETKLKKLGSIQKNGVVVIFDVLWWLNFLYVEPNVSHALI